MQKNKKSIETILTQIGTGRDEATGGISFPIYPSATYRHPAVGESTGYDYSRSANPTRDIAEEAIAELEGGARGLLFSSGMAALTTLFLMFKSGDHLIVSEDLYGGTYRVLDRVFAKFGVTASYVDTSNTDAVAVAVTESTRAVLVETPGNPLLGVADIEAIAAICKKQDVLLVVDNTFMTPILQRPLDLGADVVVHSATKYMAGHSDLTAGALVVKRAELGEELYFFQNSTGAILSPQECWLLMRSLKTLHLRMEQHCKGAAQVAEWLSNHPSVETVYYPGLADHPGHDLACRQTKAHGGMLSFRVKDAELARNCLERLQLISFAESLGGVESLMTLPAIQTHGDIPEEERLRLGICESLLRLSVGVENPDDLITDLAQALAG